jgi:hypothetical protein
VYSPRDAVTGADMIETSRDDRPLSMPSPLVTCRRPVREQADTPSIESVLCASNARSGAHQAITRVLPGSTVEEAPALRGDLSALWGEETRTEGGAAVDAATPATPGQGPDVAS